MPLTNVRLRQTVLGRFFSRFPGGGKLLIISHNHPDPDSVSSAAALQEIASVLCGARTTIVYAGVIGRSENAHMVEYLGVKLKKIERIDLSSYDRIAMVDTQPCAGNNSLPDGVIPDLVIDHHPVIRSTAKVPYADIRVEYGATASILADYIFKFGLGVRARLATALLYAIKSETQDLGRDAHPVDIECYLKLFPYANKRVLSKIINARVSRNYFQNLKKVIHNSQVVGNAVIARLPEVPYPDIVSEFADLLLRLEGAAWAYCSGYYKGAVCLSIRTTNPRKHAGTLMGQIVKDRGNGGGHSLIAGGKVDVPGLGPGQVHKVQEQLETRFLTLIHKDHHSRSPLT